MMEITLLGTGSPIPDPNRAGPSALVRAGGQVFLVDCGRGVLQRAAAVGMGAGGLSALLLTHLHSDHIGDLGDLLITRWVTDFAPDPAPLPIIGPPGTADTVEATLKAFRPDISYRIAHHADLNAPTPDEGPPGAGAVVHTVSRKDIVTNTPQQRLNDICDYHPSVQEAAATAA